MPLIHTYLRCYLGSHLLAVASEHHHLRHSERAERCHGLCAVGLHTVAHHDMPGIHSINSHMYDSADMVAVVPLHADALHQLGIAHVHLTAGHHGTGAAPCYLLNI